MRIVCESRAAANNMAKLCDYYALVEDNGKVMLLSRQSYMDWIRENRAQKTSKGLLFSSRYIAERYAVASAISNFSVHKYKDGYRVLVPLE